MSASFEFTSVKASGKAPRGRVESVAGSLVNRAQIWVQDGWEGSLTPGDSIKISVYFAAATGEQALAQIFVGVVSVVRPSGDFLLVESVSPSAYLLLAAAPVKSWVNVSIGRVMSDLISSTSMDSSLVFLSSGFSDKSLHCWNTDGGLVAHELTELLAANAPNILMSSAPDGSLVIGSREDQARALHIFAFPSDASSQDLGVTDVNRVRFAMQPACAHQGVYDPVDGSFLGTIDQAIYVVRPGQAYTEIVLDPTPDAGVAAYVSSNGGTAPTQANAPEA